MEYDFDNDVARDFDEIWFNHAAQLMNLRNLTPARAATASLALMRRVFGADVGFTSWLAKQEARTHPRDE
jgi:hypothetical protein